MVNMGVGDWITIGAGAFGAVVGLILISKKHRPEIVRGQLSENFFRDKNCSLNWVMRFLLTNLMGNFLTKPDFVAYKFEDRDCLAPGLCRKLWGRSSSGGS